MGWEAGVYEYGSVYGLCMSISGCLWVEKRMYISIKCLSYVHGLQGLY